MKKYMGYCNMRLYFEVEDDATDLDVEQAFNDAIQDKFDGGFDGSVGYNYQEV